MARRFKQLRDRVSPEPRERLDKHVPATLLEMNLQELRQRVAGITKTDLAELMKVTQGAISQLEKRHDVLLRQLVECIHAPGGDLELIARFSHADVRITQFDAEKKRAAANE